MKQLSLTQRIFFLSLTFFLLMIVVAVFHEDGILTVFEFEKELGQLKEQNASLARENQALREEIQALKTDPLAIEKIAREKLNLVKPGDTVYQIVRQGSASSGGP